MNLTYHKQVMQERVRHVRKTVHGPHVDKTGYRSHVDKTGYGSHVTAAGSLNR